jgi:hypothetical protein
MLPYLPHRVTKTIATGYHGNHTFVVFYNQSKNSKIEAFPRFLLVYAN